MKNKINITLSLIAIFAVVTSVVGVSLLSYRAFERQVRNDIRVDAQLLKASGVFDVPNSDVDRSTTNGGNTAGGRLSSQNDLDVKFRSINADNLRITWIDGEGNVIFDNDSHGMSFENHKNRPEVIQALETGKGESTRTSDTFRTNTYYYALSLDNGTVIRVAKEVRSIYSVFAVILPAIILIALLILVICLIISQILTRQILKPIGQIAEDIELGNEIPENGEYLELRPLIDKIRSQHDNILQAARNRQDFTASVSHELKTPLTAISGYAELIENHMVEPEQEIYFAGQIRANADRLVNMINETIRLSELDDKEIDRRFEPTDIDALARSICEDMQMNASKRNVNLHYEGSSIIRMVEPNLIAELIVNLVQNAITYNKDNGNVWVNVKENEGKAHLRITDDGIGIPADSIDRIFERFYRVDKSRSRERGGTGLGLAIVKHIAEIHGADISIDSLPGKGTTIEVSL